MKKKLFIFIIVALFFTSTINIPNVHAAADIPNTRIILKADNIQYQEGSTITISINGQNIKNMFGVQYILKYDPTMMELLDSGINNSGSYKSYGGDKVDEVNGILSSALINSNPSKVNDTIVKISFKALKSGNTEINLSNIKAVEEVENGVKQIDTNTDDKISISIKAGGSNPGGDSPTIPTQPTTNLHKKSPISPENKQK